MAVGLGETDVEDETVRFALAVGDGEAEGELVAVAEKV